MSRVRNFVRLASLAVALVASLAILLGAPVSEASPQASSRAGTRSSLKPAVSAKSSRRVVGAGARTGASTALTPERRRLTDEDIVHDLAIYDGWQRTLDSLSSADPRPGVYHLAAAQGLLNLARQQYERGDRCGATEVVLDEAASQIQRMRAGDPDLPVGAPAILHAGEMRPDLWKLASDLRGHAGFRCVETQIARSEAMLVSAAHEAFERQACDSERLVADAQALLDEARATADACVARDAAPPVAPAINPRSPERRAVLLREIELLPRYVRFDLDSATVDPATALILDLVADKLAKYPEIRVRLSGHAVSRASLAYNLLLSKQRAESVRTYFVRAGIADDRMDLEYSATPMSPAEREKIDAIAREHSVTFEYMVPEMDIFPTPPEETPKPEAKTPPKKQPRRNR